MVELIRTHYPDAEVLMGTSTAGIAHAAIVGHLMDLPMGLSLIHISPQRSLTRAASRGEQTTPSRPLAAAFLA